MKVAVFAVSAAFVALSGMGDVFYWRGGTAWADYSDPANWAMSQDGSTPATRIPGADDRIWSGGTTGYDVGYRLGFFNLNGGAYTFDGYTGTGTTPWKNYYLDLTNGTLTVKHAGYQYAGNNIARRITLWNGATLVYEDNDTEAKALAAGGLSEVWTLHPGSRMEIYAGILVHGVGKYTYGDIEPGATMIFSPDGFGTSPNNSGGFTIYNRGTFTAENGIIWNTRGWTTISSAAEDFFTLRQISGSMLLGGDFAKTMSNGSIPAHMTFSLEGGTLEITNSVRFYTADAAKTLSTTKVYYETQVYAEMPAGSNAVLDVKADSSIDMTPFTYGADTSLTKIGPGSMTIGATRPTALNVSEGTLFLGTAVADLSGITLASGTTLGFAVPGIELAAIANAANLRFTVPATFSPNDTVFTSSDAALLETVRANFDVPAALSAYVPYVFGNHIILVDATENQFMSIGEADLSTVARWTGGAVPSAAIIRGDDTVGILSDDTPAFDSIIVRGGGTLKITAAHIDLPAITLDTNARLVLDEGIWASLSNTLTCVCTPDTLPVFEISTNATLAVPAGTEFKNVDLRHYGLIDMQPSANNANNYVAFGSATAANEISYFAMTCIGGTVHVATGSDRAQRFVYADNGGRVKVKGQILLKDYTHDMNGSTSANGPWFGYGNPTNEPFEIVVDNSIMDICRTSSHGGGGTVRFVNGARLMRHGTHPGSSTGFNWNNELKMVLESGAGFIYPRSMSPASFTPGYAGTPVVTVGPGGWFDSHLVTGNGKGVVVASNGVWCVDAMPFIPYDKVPYPPDGDVRNWVSDLFDGFLRVQVEPEASLILASVNIMGMTASQQQDRFAKIAAGVPITGEGGLVVSNGVPGYGFAAVMVNGENTATGRLKVLPADDPTTFFFNDGANWAGTVEGDEGVAFTNLVDGAAPASVRFGGLDLTGDFPVRYWKSGAGITNDTIALDAALTGTGRIFPVCQAGEPVQGETMVLGEYPASAGTPDNALIERHWRFTVTPTEDPDKVLLGCRYTPLSTKIILR